MTLTKILRICGLADRATVHGFRSSFRTWAAERTSVPHAVAEMALSHAVGSDVERSYSLLLSVPMRWSSPTMPRGPVPIPIRQAGTTRPRGPVMASTPTSRAAWGT